MKKINVLLDTDIGSDIDDSECLAYLLSQSMCNLVGITTVSGEPTERAKLASAIVKVAKKRVPIHPGAPAPMCSANLQPSAAQKAKLPNWPHTKKFEEFSAVEFMKEMIFKHPNDITLLAIGPLTNIGTLFASYPEVVPLIRELVIMGGDFLHDDAIAEWNIKCDPYAAKIVFDSGVKMRCAGLDVTRKVVMDNEEFKKKFTSEILKPVYDFSAMWFDHAKVTYFHDPLVATLIFKPELCTMRRGKVQVVTSGEHFGRTFFTEGFGNHYVAESVDADGFFKHYFNLTSK